MDLPVKVIRFPLMGMLKNGSHVDNTWTRLRQDY